MICLAIFVFLAMSLILSAAMTFAADPLPDLILEYVSVPDGNELELNQPATFYATIYNSSPISVTSVPVRLFDVSGKALVEEVVPLVDGYDNADVELDWTPSRTGVYTVAAQIDPDNLITETNEINNRQ